MPIPDPTCLRDTGAPVRVLIVDDSSTMRRLIRASIDDAAGLLVVGEAGTAREARDAVNALVPDVLTLDVEMPGIDGLDFLARLMRARPTPVVMISSLTDHGSEAAVRALSLGAVDCLAKPRRPAGGKLFPTLASVLMMAARARVRGAATARSPASPAPPPGWRWNGRTVLIGASTGGVEALETVLGRLPVTAPPVLITQHMPQQFLVSFSARLNRGCAPAVRLARDGDRLRQGQVLIAPGGDSHLVLSPDRPGTVRLVPGPKRSGHRPSVDELFCSAVPYGSEIVAAILTGMGADGAEGMRRLSLAGAHCLAQDEASSVVYGMPRQAVALGGAQLSMPLGEIAGHLMAQTGRTPALRHG